MSDARRARGAQGSPIEQARAHGRGLRAHLAQRVDALTSVLLVLPLYVVYQLGVLLRMDCFGGMCTGVRNGADFFTDTAMAMTGGSRMTVALLALFVGAILGGVALYARRQAKLHPRLFVPVLLESTLYASLVGPVSVGLQRVIGLGARRGGSFFDDVVSSFGAGLHEEFVFRAVLFAGGLWLLKRAGLKAWHALAIALLGSSFLFSLVHHLGPLGEPFTLRAFTFRFAAGLVFAAIFRFRGFAVAAWTHAIYDVWVLGLARLAA